MCKDKPSTKSLETPNLQSTLSQNNKNCITPLKERRKMLDIRYLHNHEIRRVICISAGLTALLCRISLQFCCDFIDKNEHIISSVWDTANVIKLPTQILSICNTMCFLQSLIEERKNPKVVKIIGKSAFLVSDIISLLNKSKIIHLFFKNNAISHINFASAFLFLFISEPISYYYSYKKYQESKKVYQKNKDDENEYIKCRKSFIISNVIFTIGLLNFLFKRIDIATIPIELGSGIVYNFNVSVTISMLYTVALIMLSVDKLLNQINEPSSDLHDHDIDSIQTNETSMEVT